MNKTGQGTAKGGQDLTLTRQTWQLFSEKNKGLTQL